MKNPCRNCKPGLAMALVTLLCLGAVGGVQAQTTTNCGPIQNAFGPFDYRTAMPEQKHLVESAHFTPVVESLIRGNTTRRPGGDIDYTLRVFPNHHRALVATVGLGRRENSDKPTGMRYGIDCWFERAIRFQPDDAIVRMIFADYLGQKGRKQEALAQLQYAEREAADSPLTHYNVGLGYFAIGEHERALIQAHRSMAMGMPRTELKEALQSLGKWTEPAPSRAATPASPASADAPRTESK